MTADLKEFFLKLSKKTSLSSEDMTNAVELIVSGFITDEDIEKFLLLLREKGETAEEIVAAAKVMRKYAVKFSDKFPDLLDTCGTGGDNLSTFNISTLAALVACAGGVRIAKHGNRSVSSVLGSADILELLGVKIDLTVNDVETLLEKTGFAFLFAPNFHPAMRSAMPARKRIQGKTIFNLLGPLCNPARVQYQVLGVYDHHLLGLMAQSLKDLGVKRALVVHGADGVDEISISSQTHMIELIDNQLKEIVFSPEDCGILRAPIDYLRCKDKKEAAALALAVLKGKKGAASDVVCLNAAAAFYISGKSASFKIGAALARELILSGKVYEKLEEIISLSKEL